METQTSRLLTLPYDIRHLIYQHLFPSNKLIYIQANHNRLVAYTSTGIRIALNLLKTCHQLHLEASEYLYNNYLFHIVGQKQDCLAHYASLQRTLQKYARSKVHIHPLSNGAHSRTGAILFHIGDARLASVKARGRGMPVSVEELRREAAGAGGSGRGLVRELRDHVWDPFWWAGVVGMLAALVAMLDWMLS